MSLPNCASSACLTFIYRISSLSRAEQVSPDDLIHTCEQNNTRLIICGLQHQPLDMAQRSGLLALIPPQNRCTDLASGLTAAAA